LVRAVREKKKEEEKRKRKGEGEGKGERHVTNYGSDEPIDPDQMRRPTLLESLH
jgi:hypothetical protein